MSTWTGSRNGWSLDTPTSACSAALSKLVLIPAAEAFAAMSGIRAIAKNDSHDHA